MSAVRSFVSLLRAGADCAAFPLTQMSVQRLPLCANVGRQSRAEAFRIPNSLFVVLRRRPAVPWFLFAAFGVGLLPYTPSFPMHSAVPALRFV